jgi:SAM-dependent methyltransferase
MRDNVRHFLELLTEVIDVPAPVLELGALQTEGQESYADVRPFFRGRAYVGSDMRAGPGVDCLADAHRLPFRDGSLGTVLLLDTLEHLQGPVAAVQEACRVLAPDGIVVLASVMNFPIHGFPSDYWRFTPAAFDYLLSALDLRVVFSQGDAEFPHTVIGLGTRASGEAADAFRAAAQEIETRWPEAMAGGPLLAWQPSAVVVSQRLAERPLPELERGRTIAQSFVCPADDMSRIDVRMSNLGRLNSCHVQFRLQEEDEPRREVAAYRLFCAHIFEETWTFVPVPLQAESAGRRYRLTLESPDGAPGQAVTAMASDGTAYGDGQLFVDGEPAEGSLCFQVYCRSAAQPVSEAAMAGSPPTGTPAGQPVDDIASLVRRAEEARWEQTRYLASVVRSGFDAMHADLKETRDRLALLEEVQRRALEESTDAAAFTRAVRRNPLYRIWRRLFPKAK